MHQVFFFPEKNLEVVLNACLLARLEMSCDELIPSRERENISSQTGSSENHRLKHTLGWRYASSQGSNCFCFDFETNKN